jgi:hypothetical protein
MKMLMLVLSLSFSFSAFAFYNDLECDGYSAQGQRALIEVERGFGGSMRDARTIVYGARGTNPVETRYRIYSARRFGSRIEYIGDGGFRLEVDVFPDQSPRWGRTYWAHFQGLNGLRCRYPNAQ